MLILLFTLYYIFYKIATYIVKLYLLKPCPKFIPSLKARVFFWKKDKMTEQEVNILHQAMEKMIDECDVNGNDFESEIISNYSGKGMYEKETYALKINSFGSLLQALMTFPELLYDDDNDPISQHKVISKFHTDEIELSTVIY